MLKLKTTALAAVMVLLSTSTAISQQFTWRHGSNSADQWGNYGTIGTSSNSNDPGGRDGSCSWTDASGNLWMFGGYGWDDSGNEDYLCDLWKYNTSTSQWTWVHGSSAAYVSGYYGTQGIANSSNNPGGRVGSVTWVDSNGNLWLFGGEGYDATGNVDVLNDVWKYTISTNQWTWMKGSSYSSQIGTYGTLGAAATANTPGSRYLSTAWSDGSGNLWTYGGGGYDASGNYGTLSDLWKYNVSTNQWTWIKGSNQADAYAVYGTQGTAATANTPGGRYTNTSWKDASGNFWLFGGLDYTYDNLNDLWQYNVSTNQWTWVKGASYTGQSGVYGTMGTSSSANTPGARYISAGWADGSGNFWLFGGTGYDAYGSNDLLNDLWKFNTVSNQWTWINGSNSVDQSGIYGTMGVAAASNMPGARYITSLWTNTVTNTVWFFGSLGYDEYGTDGELNDLWSFGQCTAQTLAISSSANSLCTGQTATLTASGATNYQWSTLQTGAVIVVTAGTAPASYTVTSTDPNSCSNYTTFTELVSPNPIITITQASLTSCAGVPVQLAASGANTFVWTNDQNGNTENTTNAVTFSIAPLVTTSFTITGTNAAGCTATTTAIQMVSPNPTVSVIQTSTASCTGDMIELGASGANTYVWSNDQNSNTVNTSTLSASPLVTTNYIITGTGANGCTGTLSVTQKVVICTGIKTNGAASANVQIYPNPNNGSFTIKLNASAQKSQLSIFNAIGQKVFEQELNEETQIDHKLPNGVYFYNVSQSGSSTANGKLIVE